LFHTQDSAFLVGGSGLYIQAVCKGIDEMPGPDLSLRQHLISRLESDGLESLAVELKSLDPESWQEIDLNNPKRVLRALEVIYKSSRKFSSLKKRKPKQRNFDYVKIGLEMDRELLYQQINHRADRMLEAGLIEEAKKLYPNRHLTALQTVGYQEFFDYFDGQYDIGEAIRLFKRNTRRYAKKQISWFGRDPEIHWFNTGSILRIREFIDKFLFP
jgi:tRNA dimethylallyltransferase